MGEQAMRNSQSQVRQLHQQPVTNNVPYLNEITSLKKQLSRLHEQNTSAPAWEAILEAEEHLGPNVTFDKDLDVYMHKTMHSANALVSTCALEPEGEGVVSPEHPTCHSVERMLHFTSY
jgi:hypothetical protein